MARFRFRLMAGSHEDSGPDGQLRRFHADGSGAGNVIDTEQDLDRAFNPQGGGMTRKFERILSDRDAANPYRPYVVPTSGQHTVSELEAMLEDARRREARQKQEAEVKAREDAARPPDQPAGQQGQFSASQPLPPNAGNKPPQTRAQAEAHLMAMSMNDLKAIAHEEKVNLHGKTSKEQIVKAIVENQTEED